MSGTGAPELRVSGAGRKIAIVYTSWHTEVVDGLLAGAEAELFRAECKDIKLLKVPGAFELPLGAKFALEAGADAVIALGVVIQGETPHFDYVCDAATSGLAKVQIEYGKPIGFGLLTVDNLQQALDRAGLEGSREDKGKEAAQAVLSMLELSK